MDNDKRWRLLNRINDAITMLFWSMIFLLIAAIGAMFGFVLPVLGAVGLFQLSAIVFGVLGGSLLLGWLVQSALKWSRAS